MIGQAMTRRRRTRQSSSWPDLPPELLADVLGRLQLGDRVRFRSVCSSWRAAERDNPCRFPMPWLVASGRCVSLHDAAIYRAPLTDQDARGAACRGSFGNWLALVPTSSDSDGHCRPFLLHAFTMARIKLPRWTGEPINKIVLSSAPDSECCTVAAIVPASYDIAMKLHSLTAVCRCPGHPGSRWSISTNPREIQDIAFFNGNLYAVDGKEHIYMYEKERLKELREKNWKKIPRYRSDASWLPGRGRSYLVPCHGRLIMVSRSLRKNDGRGHSSCPSAVYAFDEGGDSYSWVTVSSLEGHAMFVGDACCRAFTVEASSSGSKIRENQICFVDEELAAVLVGRTPFRSLQSYDVRSRCLRTYRPTSAAGPWRCDTVQRLPLWRCKTMPPPPRTSSEAQLWLCEVLDCLGAGEPHYTTVTQSVGIRLNVIVNVIAESRLDVTAHVSVAIPKARANGYHQFRFEGRHQSGHQAAHVAAHEAVTFLRSAFRNTLDDSPWSSIPHYHTHVDDKDAEEENV